MAKIISIANTENGELDVVLELDGKRVRGLGITYLENENDEEIEVGGYIDDCVVEEWFDYADDGEEGFTRL